MRMAYMHAGTDDPGTMKINCRKKDEKHEM